ncbi:hypothetical protein MASR2M15_23660 [Anaerolineales bacterium]|jgi:maltose-binding protein MalE
MKRSKFFLLLTVFALVFATVGNALAQDELVIWADNERAGVLEELGKQFEAETGVPVTVQIMGLGDTRDQLLVAGPAGEGPDIAIIPHDSIGQLVANGAIIPLDLGDLSDSFLASGLGLFTYQNELWGMPYAMENVAMIRNVDLVPEAPATWEEVYAISEDLAADGIFGFAFHTGNTYHNYPVSTAYGGYIFGLNEDGSYNVGDIGLISEGGMKQAEFLASMYAAGFSPTDAGDDEIFSLFEEGKAAMFITGPWFSSRIDNTGINYSIDMLPGGEGAMEHGASFAGGQGFVISAFSDNQLLAEDFLLNFLANDEIMQTLFDEGGRIPTWTGVDTSADANIASFIEAGTDAQPMPAIPEMGAVWAAYDGALTLISQGEDPVVAFTTGAEQIASAITMMASDEVVPTLVGSVQVAVGCEWDPACAASNMVDLGDGNYELSLDLPAGSYEYKVAINGSWAENYGVDGAADGANLALELEADSTVLFTYNHETHEITATVQSE